MNQPKELANTIARSKEDIFYFGEHILRCSAVGDQVKFLQTVQDLTLNQDQKPKQFGCKAGTGTGKTYSLAWAGLWRWWRSPGSMHVNTAPTERQCREVFFQEISNHIGRSPVLGNLVNLGGAKLTMKDYPHWKIFAATASDENAIRGLHHPDMTIMAEELTGIREDIIAALLRTCSQKNNLFMTIFNPDRASGTAYEMFHGRRSYWPWNLTMNKLSIARDRPDLVDPEKIELVRAEFGEDSDMWRVGVLGEFPLEGARNVVTHSMAERATEVPLALALATGPPLRVISVDFARYGGDENVIYARSGNAIVQSEQMFADPNIAAARSREIMRERGWTAESTVFIIDSVGMGQALVHDYVEAGLNVVEFHPNRRSPVQGYANVQSAAYFNLRQQLKNGQLHLPNDPILFEQLTTREYGYRKGDIEVESKAQYQQRGFKKSPDRADALVMAFAEAGDILGSLTMDYGLAMEDMEAKKFDIFDLER